MSKNVYQMGINYTLDVIGGKWKPILLYHIGLSPKRNGELLKLIPQISQKVLTQQLRDLEEHGIVYRKSYPEIPPRIEYHLTEDGEELRSLLVCLSNWGDEQICKLNKGGEEILVINKEHDGFAQ